MTSKCIKYNVLYYIYIMICPYCNSNHTTNAKVHITKPIGAKKWQCKECYKTFIENENENNSYTLSPDGTVITNK